MKMNRILVALLLGGSLGFFILFLRSSPVKAIQYGSDFRLALEDAKTEGKPLLINFGGPW